MPIVKDFHTHNLLAEDAIINVPEEWLLCPSRFSPREGAFYSVGIHPWWTIDNARTAQILGVMPSLLTHPQVVAVGECGIDRLRGADEDEQTRIFLLQAEMAEKYRLPMTLHIVRAYDVLLRLKKSVQPTVKWTVHGFRGKPSLAKQLLDAGIDLSFGKYYHAESWAMTPPERRHRETDDERIE